MEGLKSREFAFFPTCMLVKDKIISFCRTKFNSKYFTFMDIINQAGTFSKFS